MNNKQREIKGWGERQGGKSKKGITSNQREGRSRKRRKERGFVVFSYTCVGAGVGGGNPRGGCSSTGDGNGWGGGDDDGSHSVDGGASGCY